MSDPQHLIQMANDIGNFFRAQPREEAIVGIENHIRSYWTRRMCEKLFKQANEPASGLDDLPHQAVKRLIERPRVEVSEPPGGDAG